MPEISTGLLMDIVSYLDEDCINNTTKRDDLINQIMFILEPYK